jgi:ribosomal protein L3 glutamine methyltransferase
MSKMLKTVKDFVHYAIQQFKQHHVYYGHGTTNAKDEAWWLVLGFLKLPLIEREEFSEKILNPTEQQALLLLIERRAKEKIPVAYLLQEAYLRGYKFYVNKDVLIPRSPIAELIEQRFAPWFPSNKIAHNILDLCTGSACLAILCAYYFKEAQVNASDISPAALRVAEKNIKQHQLEKKLTLIQSDLFVNIPKKRYDIIISNPPYVDAKDLKTMPEEYHHEPRLGLAAGEDGLAIVRRIINQAKEYLTNEGLLIVEVGNSQTALIKAYPQLPFIWLEFEYGGSGVFLLHQKDLKRG